MSSRSNEGYAMKGRRYISLMRDAMSRFRSRRNKDDGCEYLQIGAAMTMKLQHALRNIARSKRQYGGNGERAEELYYAIHGRINEIDDVLKRIMEIKIGPLKEQLDSANAEVEKLKKEVAAKDAEIKKLNNEIAAANKRIEELEAELKELREKGPGDIARKDEEIDKLHKDLAKLKELENQYGQLKDLIENIGDLLGVQKASEPANHDALLAKVRGAAADSRTVENLNAWLSANGWDEPKRGGKNLGDFVEGLLGDYKALLEQLDAAAGDDALDLPGGLIGKPHDIVAALIQKIKDLKGAVPEERGEAAKLREDLAKAEADKKELETALGKEVDARKAAESAKEAAEKAKKAAEDWLERVLRELLGEPVEVAEKFLAAEPLNIKSKLDVFAKEQSFEPGAKTSTIEKVPSSKGGPASASAPSSASSSAPSESTSASASASSSAGPTTSAVGSAQSASATSSSSAAPAGAESEVAPAALPSLTKTNVEAQAEAQKAKKPAAGEASAAAPPVEEAAKEKAKEGSVPEAPALQEGGHRRLAGTVTRFQRRF